MKASKDLFLREIAGEAVLVPVGEISIRLHGVIGLSESGLLIWKKLQEKDCSEDELVEAMLAEYNIDETTARSDVQAFISKMNELGIVEM